MTRTWLQTKLGEVCSLRGGSAFSRDLQGRDSGELPFIKVSDFEHPENSYRIVSANNWITVEDAKSIRAKPHPAGATVFAKIGIALLSNRRRLLIRDTLIDNNLMSASPRGSVDSQFLFYLLRTLDFGSHAGGSALPYLTAKDLNAIAIEVPQPPEQRAIAGVLGALDDKIEQNRRTAQALERLARAIFRAWFVDFEPVKAKAAGATAFPSMPQPVFDALPTRFVDSAIGPVPEGWDVGALKDLATLSKTQIKPQENQTGIFDHFSIPAFDAGMRAVVESGSAIKSNKFLVVEGCVLLSKLNPRIPRVWLPPPPRGRQQIASTEFLVFLPRSVFDRYYLYCQFQQVAFRDELAQGASGTSNSHQRVRPNDLLEKVVVVPPTSIRKGFADIAGPIFALAATNHVESATLAEMRDYLLPKLLSGEVQVDRAADQAQGATG